MRELPARANASDQNPPVIVVLDLALLFVAQRYENPGRNFRAELVRTEEMGPEQIG